MACHSPELEEGSFTLICVTNDMRPLKSRQMYSPAGQLSFASQKVKILESADPDRTVPDSRPSAPEKQKSHAECLRRVEGAANRIVKRLFMHRKIVQILFGDTVLDMNKKQR